MAADIKAGILVMLKSGGPDMTGGQHPAGNGLGGVLVVRRVEADEAGVSAYLAEALRLYMGR